MLRRFVLAAFLLTSAAGCVQNQTLPETTATPTYRPEDILEASSSVRGRTNLNERVAVLEAQMRAMQVEMSRVSGATKRLEARQLQTIGVTPEPRSKAARLETPAKPKTQTPPPAPAKAEPPPEPPKEEQVASAPPAPEPEAAPPAEAPPAAPAPAAEAAGAIGYAVQLGAFGSIERAAAGWEEIKSRGGDLLGDLLPKREETTLAGKPIFRLKAGPLPDEASAQQRCGALKAQGIPCIVTLFSGDWPSS